MQTIRHLAAADAPRIEAHLQRLSADDRASRFATGGISDAGIRDYVSRIRFGWDVTLGCFDGAGLLVGFAHGCVFRLQGLWHLEVALSIDAAHQRRGMGTALMRRMQVRAVSLGIDTVVGSCAARNLGMKKVFLDSGWQIIQEECEIQARDDLTLRRAWLQGSARAEHRPREHRTLVTPSEV